VELGPDDAGRHAVDPDAVGGDLLGQADGHGVDGGLGRRIVDVLAGTAEGRGGRGDVDDGSAAGPGHVADGAAGAEQVAEHVHLQGAAHPGRVGVGEAPVGPAHPGIVDQTGDRAEVRRGVEELVDPGLVGRVRACFRSRDRAPTRQTVTNRTSPDYTEALEGRMPYSRRDQLRDKDQNTWKRAPPSCSILG
jgi:hypothetical protein